MYKYVAAAVLALGMASPAFAGDTVGLTPLLTGLDRITTPLLKPVTNLTQPLVGRIVGTAAAGPLPALGRIVAPINNNVLVKLGNLTNGALRK